MCDLPKCLFSYITLGIKAWRGNTFVGPLAALQNEVHANN